MIAIIDYGAGNIQSVNKALKYIGCDCVVTRDKDMILKADGAGRRLIRRYNGHHGKLRH